MQTIDLGAVLLLFVFLAYIIAAVNRRKTNMKSLFVSGRKAALLRTRIADSLEECRPIHLSVGSTMEGDPASGNLVTAMDASGIVSAQMALADEPWLITCGTGAAAEYGKTVVKNGLDAVDYGNEFDAGCTLHSGLSPVSQHASAIMQTDNTPSSLHVNIGTTGPAASLQAFAFGTDESIFTAGDDPAAQAVCFPVSDGVFIGDQSHEIPMILGNDTEPDTALLAMDILKYVLTGIILCFVVIGLAGV